MTPIHRSMLLACDFVAKVASRSTDMAAGPYMANAPQMYAVITTGCETIGIDCFEKNMRKLVYGPMSQSAMAMVCMGKGVHHEHMVHLGHGVLKCLGGPTMANESTRGMGMGSTMGYGVSKACGPSRAYIT